MLGVVDFIKKYGWLVAIQQLKISKEAFNKGSDIYSNSFVGLTIHKNQNHGPLSNSDFSFYFEELEMYIDAYELVQKLNGVDNCKYLIKNHQHWFDVDGLTAIKQAIALIEEI